VNALGAIRTTPTGAYVTPVYQAFRLHAGRAGDLGVPTTVESPRLLLPGVADLAAIDAAATLSQDRRTLYLSVINRHPTQPARVKLDLAGFQAADGEWAAMVGDEITAANSAERPDAVRLETRPLKAEEQREMVIPAHTAAVITLRAR
jgi:alpha-L-arabinofuranosidase